MGQSKTLLLTGGHAGATAYALVQALKKNKAYSWKVHFVGAKSAVEGKKVLTFEEKVLPSMGVDYHAITSGRLQRKFSLQTIPSISKIPIGFMESFKLVKKINPDIILSFGGFASFPVVVLGKLLGIKVIIHEQTAAYGRANKFSEVFADKIALSRETSKKYFNFNKVVVTGNPVLSEINTVSLKTSISTHPTIFVTGGSRGASIINEAVALVVPKLLSRFRIIHQVGEVEEEKYKQLKDDLGFFGKNYEVYGVVSPSKKVQLIEKSDIVISRAGANTVSELIIAKRPSILIPIPWTFADEQNKNAQFAKEFGIARILPQDKLTPESLLAEIELLMKNWEKMMDETRSKVSPDINASKALVDLLVSELK